MVRLWSVPVTALADDAAAHPAAASTVTAASATGPRTPGYLVTVLARGLDRLPLRSATLRQDTVPSRLPPARFPGTAFPRRFSVQAVPRALAREGSPGCAGSLFRSRRLSDMAGTD